MKAVKLIIALAALLHVTLSIVMAESTDPLSKVNRLPPALEQIAKKVTTELTGKGYEVKRGYWALWGSDQCKYTINVLGRCFGPNPTAPYVVPFVPSWRDEFVDKTVHNVFGPERRGYSPIYRLDKTEALVFLAVLPPPGAYLGVQTYAFTREGDINPNDPIYLGVSEDLRALLFAAAPNPSRHFVWSTMGDSTNQVVIKKQTGEEWKKDQQRFFILSPDKGTVSEVTRSLLDAGVPDAKQIFVEPVAANLVNLGLHAAADDFQTYLRFVQVPENEDGKAWRERLPLTVLRVRNTSRTPEPYPIPEYDKKTATSELFLESDLKTLISEVKTRWGQPDATVQPFIVAELMWPAGLDTVGQHCLVRPMNCLGDNQDDSFRISPTISLDPGLVVPDGVLQGDAVAIVGTLATATGNATYVSLAMNTFPEAVSFDNLTNLDLAGSASGFPVSHSDKFYVYYLSRNCAGWGSNCREIPESVVPFGGLILLAERNYVNPQSDTGRAPDAALMLTPSVIILKGK